MPYNNLKLDGEFTKQLLDIYTEVTGISIALITDSDNIFWSEKARPIFCKEVCKIIGFKCVEGLSIKIDGLYKCNAGLWLYSHQIKNNENDVIGTFLIGPRRILGKEKESKEALERFYATNKDNINDKNYERLTELWEQSDNISSDYFDSLDIKLLEKFSFIEKYVSLARQRAIEEHERKIAMKNEAVSLAHEFLLPIQSIIADAENLVNEAEESEFKSTAEDILQEVIKLYYTAENIRGSILEERKYKYEVQNVNIYQIIEDAINLFRKEARKKGIIIKDPIIKGNISSLSIEISKPHIKQVFFNLFHNAVKYSYTGTDQTDRYISTICKSHKNYYCVEITNFGVGIRPEEISQGLIFENGYRGLFSRDQSRIGSGFGLGRVKEIIEAHNGYIEVESKPLAFDYKFGPYKTTVKVCIPFHQKLSDKL